MDFVLPNKNFNKLVIRFYFYKKLLIVIKVKYDITTPNLFNLLFQKDSLSKCGHIDWEVEALPAQVGLGHSWIPPSVGRCKVMNWEVFKNSTFQTWYVICGGVLIQNHERHVMAAMCGSVVFIPRGYGSHVWISDVFIPRGLNPCIDACSCIQALNLFTLDLGFFDVVLEGPQVYVFEVVDMWTEWLVSVAFNF